MFLNSHTDLFIIRGSELLATPLDYEVESVVNITVSSTDDGLPPRSTEVRTTVTSKRLIHVVHAFYKNNFMRATRLKLTKKLGTS